MEAVITLAVYDPLKNFIILVAANKKIYNFWKEADETVINEIFTHEYLHYVFDKINLENEQYHYDLHELFDNTFGAFYKMKKLLPS